MGLAHSPRIVTNGLVLCLDAANRKSYPGSGTTWKDISRRGNDATLINGATFNGADKGSIAFDGVNDIATIPNTVDTRFPHNSAWTLSLFVKVISQGNYPYVVYVGSDQGSGFAMWTTTSGGGLFVVKHNNAQQSFCPTNYGTIKNLTLVYSGSGTVLGYENAGIPVSLISLSSTDTTSVLQFANSNSGLNLYHVLKYNRALSATEVAQNFNATRGRFGI